MFEGFSPETLKFFRQLKKNNQRDWFAENKSWYEDAVLFPALELVKEIEKPLTKLSPCFTAVAKRSGGSVLRIYRDTRFSKDKTPYKLNLGINFRHMQGKDVHAPGFYFHVSLEEVLVGCGIWKPPTPDIADIRSTIDEDPARWKRVVNRKAFRETFERTGSTLKRPPRGYAEDHPQIIDLKRKDHIAMSPLDVKDLYDRDLIDKLIKRFKTAMPYVRFLCDALRLPS